MGILKLNRIFRNVNMIMVIIIWFFLGYEVVYVEVECLLEFLSVKYLIIKGYEFLEVFMFYFNKGYNCIKIR